MKVLNLVAESALTKVDYLVRCLVEDVVAMKVEKLAAQKDYCLEVSWAVHWVESLVVQLVWMKLDEKKADSFLQILLALTCEVYASVQMMVELRV